MHRVLERQLRKVGIGEGAPTAEQWVQLLERVDRSYVEADQDRYTLERALELSSVEMRQRFDELRAAQRQLVQASRKAGMADVATTVLHNIGNVLNSVNVSSTMLADQLKSSTRAGLGKSLALLHAQPAPGKFLDEDPRGKKLLAYLAAVDVALAEEREKMLAEIASLAKHIEHIKGIVSQQLASARGDARGVKVTERVNVDELIDDAIEVLRSSLPAPDAIRFVRDGESTSVDTDRHKLFQIVMNLLANARDAIAGRPGAGVITIRARRLGEGRVALEVQDDGVGIDEETRARMFAHGFTTKPTGHGFGLHSSACAAMELGGALTAHSDGHGHGATFTVVVGAPRAVTRSGSMARVSVPPRAEALR
jgi:signal transduction histidine kinase